MRRELQVVWKRVRPQQGYANSAKNIVLRQTFAIKMILSLQDGRKIINFDETTIKSTNQRAYSYAMRGSSNSRCYSRDIPGLSLLLAVSQDGLRIFRFIQGTHNTWTFLAFMLEMISMLDVEVKDWRERYIVVLDNCPAHASEISMRVLTFLRVPLMFTAPASYAALPVEGIFAGLKALDLEQIEDPSDDILKELNMKKVNLQQKVIFKVAGYLNGLHLHKVERIFASRIRELAGFLSLCPV